MYLNQDSIQELQWWFNNLEICNGELIVSPTSKTVIQSHVSKKGLGACCQKVSTGGQWTLQESKLHINFYGTVSHQSRPFNVFKNVQSQNCPFSSRQYECPFISDENGGYTKQEGDSHFQRDLGICIVQRDHASCRVPAGQIERQGRLGFQKFPRLERMASISKSIPRDFRKVGIPRVGSFCIKSMPSDTILPVVESRSTQPSNRCIPTKLETSGATACFSPFFNDRYSSIKSQNRGDGCYSNNTKLASKTLVQSGSAIIFNQTSASTSVKQHLRKFSELSAPSGLEPNPKTSGLESFRQS